LLIHVVSFNVCVSAFCGLCYLGGDIINDDDDLIAYVYIADVYQGFKRIIPKILGMRLSMKREMVKQ